MSNLNLQKKSVSFLIPLGAKLVSWLFVTSLFLNSEVSLAWTFSPNSFLSTLLASRNLKAEKYEAARDEAILALKKEPFAPEHHLNLGLALEGLGQVQKAIGSYKMAEELAQEQNNPALLFQARYNQGEILGKAKKINEALESYQKALEINPMSAETKINIELLLQQQQGGKGDGEGEDKNNQDNKDDKDNKGGEGKDQKKNKDPQDVKQSKEYKPNRFKAENLSEDDAKKILEELKRQEKNIHENFDKQNQMNKDAPNDKDW